MLEAAPPSDACSSLTRRNPRPNWEAGAARGGGRGRKKMEGHRALSEERKERTKGKPVKSTTLQDGHCHSSASLLGKETTRTWRVIPMGEGTAGWPASTAPSHFSKSRGGIELACFYTHCPKRPGRLLASLTGELWRPQEKSLLPPSPAPLSPGQLLQPPVHHPVACFPKEAETQSRSTRYQEEGQGGRKS